MSTIIKRIPDTCLYVPVAVMLILALLSTGCISRSEGCLDVNADNFDLDAEKDCSSCCTYPSMLLTLTQRWGDRNFSIQDTLFDVAQRPYKIQDLKYFLTGWTWISAEGLTYTVDTVQALCESAHIFKYTPDLLLIDSRQFDYTLGTVRQAVDIREINLVMGIVEDYKCLDPDNAQTPSSVTRNSPLWNADDSTLNTLRIIIQKDLATEVLDTLMIPWAHDQPMTLSDYILHMERGNDTKIRLTADYQAWLKDADLSDLNTFIASILQNRTLVPTP